MRQLVLVLVLVLLGWAAPHAAARRAKKKAGARSAGLAARAVHAQSVAVPAVFSQAECAQIVTAAGALQEKVAGLDGKGQNMRERRSLSRWLPKGGDFDWVYKRVIAMAQTQVCAQGVRTCNRLRSWALCALALHCPDGDDCDRTVSTGSLPKWRSRR